MITRTLLVRQQQRSSRGTVLKNTAGWVIQRSGTRLTIRLRPWPQGRWVTQASVPVQMHRRLSVCSCSFKLSTRFERTGRCRSFWTVHHHGVILSDLRPSGGFTPCIATIPMRVDPIQTASLVKTTTLKCFLEGLTRRRPKVFHQRISILHPMEKHARRSTIHVTYSLKTFNDHVFVRRQGARDSRRLTC